MVGGGDFSSLEQVWVKRVEGISLVVLKRVTEYRVGV